MRALSLSLVALLASSVGLVSGAETFHEEMLARPLPDGKVAFVAHFTQEAPLLAKHYETFPRAIAEIARASRAAEAELSFTRGRWYAARWGRAPLGAKPVGAELWASFHAPPPGPGVGVASPTKSAESAADAGWRALTTLLGAQFCASLGALDSAAVAAPRLAFHAWNGSPDAVVSDRPRRVGFLPAEAVCTENLTPWLRLLPCRDRAGVGSMLRSRSAVFGAPYASFTTRFETAAAGAAGTSGLDAAPTLLLSQTVTLVLDPGDALNADGGGVQLSALLGVPNGGPDGACAASASALAHAETTSPFSAEATGAAETFGPTLRTRAGILDLAPGRVGRIVLRTWDLAALRANVGGGHGNDDAGEGDRFDLRVFRKTDAAAAAAGGDGRRSGAPPPPAAGYSPELLVSSAVTGTGNSVGGISIDIRRPAGVERGARRATRLRVFQILPWSVRAFAHSLTVEVDGVAQPGTPGFRSDGTRRGAPGRHNVSRGVYSYSRGDGDDTRGVSVSGGGFARVVEGLRWDPGSDRERPTVFEAQLLVPRDASHARVSATFEKAFLRLGEFPPDANRGFDLPPAVLTLPPPRVVRFDRAVDSGGAPVEAALDFDSPLLDALEGFPRGGGGGAVGGAAPPERAYAEGALLTLPTPDFSMPFNVITMVSTLMTVFVGAMVGVLTERQGWASFAGEKRAQRAKLAELRKKRKNDGAS